MKTIATLLASTAMLVGASAYAQTPSERTGPASRDTGQSSDTTKPAVKSSKDTTSGAPVPGANSFTESQAKSRIEARGYGNVTSLRKDEQGVWHATASKGGKQTQVALDYQGNVVEGAGASTGSSSSGSSSSSGTTPPSSSSSPTMPNSATPSPSTTPPSSTTPPATPPSNRPTPPGGSPR
ncbi:MAG: hypothetical protein JWM77_2106 [Rhodospirillales bacterium]|nr:hypothetical protein [Rhodospirillales bacterium]